MLNRRPWSSRGLLVVALLGQLACHDTEALSTPGGVAPVAGSAGRDAGTAAGGSAGAPAGQGGAPSGVGAKGGVRLVNLLAGASSLDVTWSGQPAWSGLAWPSTAPAQEQAIGGALAALVGDQVVVTASPLLTVSQDVQVALLGQVGGPTQVLSLAPSGKPGPRVRLVHAAAPLHAGRFQVGGSSQLPAPQLSFGQASDWLEVPPGDSSSWSLRVSSDVRDAYFSFQEPITQPTTLYVASSTGADLFVYAVADDGSTLQNGPPPSRASLSLNHLATGVGATLFTIDGQPAGDGAGAVAWGEQIAGVAVPPHLAEVRAATTDGTTIASTTYDLKNFAQVSFTLAGGPGGTALVPVFEGWWDLHEATPTAPRVQLLDVRPASVSPVGVSSWSPAGGWSERGSSSPLVPAPFELSADSALLGLDLDQDGVRDLRFRAGFAPGMNTTTLFSVAADGTPWLWLEQYGTSAWTPPLEFTATARLVNLTAAQFEFSVASAGPTPASGAEAWTDWLWPGQSMARSVRRGKRSVVVGGTPVEPSFAPLGDTTLLALPGGHVLEVVTAMQVEEASSALRLVNVSDEVVSATLDGSLDLGTKLGLYQQGPAVGGGQTVTVTRADKTTLTFRLPPVAPGATTLLVYGGDPSWPAVQVVHPDGVVEAVHPEETTGELDVVSVLPSGLGGALHLDAETTEMKSGSGSWQADPSIEFRYARRPLPVGEHVLHVGKPPSTIEVPVTVAVGTIARVFVLPDLTARVLASPVASTDVTVVSMAQASGPSGVLLVDGEGSPQGTLASGLSFGSWTTAAFPGGGLLPAVDVGNDGKADWQSELPLLPASVVLVIGHDKSQAVVCVKGGWAGVIGKLVP